ncbi:MAG: hypothetical protein HQQ73_11155 [Desulfobulbaceae bacterium]|nr:hypothetical protein [Desulfobulbaceae bacterium]
MIADIHGGCQALMGLLADELQPGQRDLLVTLADYIDRGPDSKEILENCAVARLNCTRCICAATMKVCCSCPCLVRRPCPTCTTSVYSMMRTRLPTRSACGSITAV